MIALEDTLTALSLASAMLIHELGHIIAIKTLGCDIHKTQLYGLGANIDFNMPHLSALYEVIIYSAGPIMGFITALLGRSLGLKLFANFSCSLSIINLIPALPLDGGNILKTILPYKKSYFAMLIISAVFGILFVILGIVIIRIKGNFSVLAIGMCIISTIISKTTLQ